MSAAPSCCLEEAGSDFGDLRVDEAAGHFINARAAQRETPRPHWDLFPGLIHVPGALVQGHVYLQNEGQVLGQKRCLEEG